MKLKKSLIVAGVVALATGGVVGAVAPAPLMAQQSIEQGERERNNTQTRTAARALEDARDADTPEEALPFYEAAATAAADGIAADPTNPLSHLQSAYAHLGLGNYTEAAAAFEEAERLRPIYILETEALRERAWIDLYTEGAQFVNAGDYEGAIEIFEAADRIYDNRPEVKLILGQLLVQLEEYDRGLEALDGAMEIINSERINEMDSTTASQWRSQAAEIPLTMTTAYINSGRLEEAKDGLRGLLEGEPNNTSYLNSLATVFVRLQQPDSAATIYSELLATDGLDATDYYNIGVGRYTADDMLGAAEAFQRAAEASVNDRDGIEMYARSMQSAHAPEEGVEPPAGVLESLLAMTERWKVLDPNNRNAYLVAAQTANRLGDSEAAGSNIAAIEALPFTVDNLSVQRDAAGGGIVVGVVTNNTAGEGEPLRMTFTFYDASGGSIGSQDVTVPAPAAAGTRQFRVDFYSDEKIHGYGYTVGM